MTSGPLIIVGDSLLDVDIEGSADRLSPDAPVPVVDVQRTWNRPGGAGLAAMIAAQSGEEVILITAIGTDDAGEMLRELLDPVVDIRPMRLRGSTPCKTRVSATGVPLLRLDTGDGSAEGAALPSEGTGVLADAGAILISDYGRGVSGLPILREQLTRQAARIPVVWDPHPRGAEPVRQCALVTPNSAEAANFSGTDELADQGGRLCDRWQARAVAITRGDRGAILTEAGSMITTTVPLLDRQARLRPDTCGAGDAFAVAAAEALRNGADARGAAQKAVIKAAEYVHAGAAACFSIASTRSQGRESNPAMPQRDAFEVADRIRRTGGRLVATGGCFDLLHRGHVSLLEQARALGDALIVCLNSDSSLRRAKGPGRPVVSQQDRARVLSALAAVDSVVIFDESTPAELLGKLRPDIWVKGTDYANRPMPEADTVRQHGGQVVLVPVIPGYSTTRLLGTASQQRNNELIRSDIPQEAS